eukprot:scaffold338090_cov35-Attheya_sp.AAC.1
MEAFHIALSNLIQMFSQYHDELVIRHGCSILWVACIYRMVLCFEVINPTFDIADPTGRRFELRF